MPNPPLAANERATLIEGQYNSVAITLTDGQRAPLPLDAGGNIKVTLSDSTGDAVTPSDKGGTITAGGTSQTLAALNVARKALVIQNPTTATENLYIALVGNATIAGAGNYADLLPGGSCVCEFDGLVYTGLVRVNAATTGHRYYATEFA